MEILIVLLFLLIILAILLPFFSQKKKFDDSDYAKETGATMSGTMGNAGNKGEYQTAQILQPFAEEGAKFLYNVYLPTSPGRTTEVDLLMIFHSGIYVVESKNYGGKIFGGSQDQNWVQEIGSARNHLYNPLKQNGGHIRALKGLLGKEPIMYSLIIFSDRADLSGVQAKAHHTYVVNQSQAVKMVRYLEENPERTLTDEQIAGYYRRLYPYAHVNANVKKQHQKMVRNIQGK